MLTGTPATRSGLDADIWMLPPNRLNLTAPERENLSSISMRRAAGAFTNSSWTPQHEAILKAAASDPRVARIFVFPGAKVAMCNTQRATAAGLNKIRPWYGHHYHFHVRLNCPAGDEICEDQAPPPAGDGCADAQAWVERHPEPAAPRSQRHTAATRAADHGAAAGAMHECVEPTKCVHLFFSLLAGCGQVSGCVKPC